MERQRIDTTRPPVTRRLLLGWVRRMSRCGVSSWGRPASTGPVRRNPRLRKFRSATDDRFRPRNHYGTDRSGIPSSRNVRSTFERITSQMRRTRSKLSVHCGHGRPRARGPKSASPTDRPTIAHDRRPGRSLRADRFQGDQRARRCVARDPPPRRGGDPRAGYHRLGPGPTGGAAPRADLPRAESRSGRWRSSAASSASPATPPGGRAVRDAWPSDARPRLDRGRPGPPSGRGHRRLHRPDRFGPDPAQDTRDPVRRRRPDRRAAPRHPVDRRHELERRPDGDPPSPRPRAPTDRRSSAGRTGSCAAVPGSTATARRWTRPACQSTRSSSATADSTSRRASSKGRALLRRPIDRPRSSPATTSRRSASTRPHARLRLHIPEDLSVVGFDDLPVARWVGPPLTTIRQPLFEMAVAAAELVLRMADGEVPAQPRVELATELVIRESTAPPRD